ncbi:MAG: NAD(+) diphosphatase [Treponema sp.]|nr:NAD(+) diphosphatase [Treponema sp.]
MSDTVRAYAFQGNSIIVPQETADSGLYEGLSLELIESSLKDIPQLDSFSVVDLEGGGDLRCLSIPEGEGPPGWKTISLRQIMSIMAGEDRLEFQGPLGRILRCCHISLWRRESRFCGSCGGRNQDAEPEETARRCSVCGRLEYPRIAPAVITIIINDRDEALLAHNAKFPAGLYSLIAGFNEAGESLEATVAREIKEEVNLEVRDIRYICSQPWPFPNSLMMGFSARYAGGEIRPDGIEIEDARWFPRDALPSLPGPGTMSRRLIELWLGNQLTVPSLCSLFARDPFQK